MFRREHRVKSSIALVWRRRKIIGWLTRYVTALRRATSIFNNTRKRETEDNLLLFHSCFFLKFGIVESKYIAKRKKDSKTNYYLNSITDWTRLLQRIISSGHSRNYDLLSSIIFSGVCHIVRYSVWVLVTRLKDEWLNLLP